ncbi:MAG: histidine phosphatase family protein [Microcoleaceae cyanobacterium]
MSHSKAKVWIGIGAYILSGASVITATAEISSAEAQMDQTDSALNSPAVPSSSSTQFVQMLAQGGEGGEGGTPAFQDKLSGSQLVDALRQGGYVIYFRHAQTEKDYADQIDAKMGDCSTQRMLSEMGWQQAKNIGQAFQALKIPVGQVYSSEYCRAWQTADLAFGRHQKDPRLNFERAEEYTEAQVAKMRSALTPMLVAAPASGMNTVIVGHDDVFESATGIYPEPQGVAYIVKPDGKGGFELIANLLSDEWGKLSR